MNSRHWFRRLAPGLLALAAIVAMAVPASAATYNLVALPSTATMPDGTTIPMWGYFLDTGQPCTATPAWAVGPKLSVNPGDSLTVNLRNCLSQPTSIVIPGQALPSGSAPVRHSSGPYAGRVRSFTTEAWANGAMATYVWPSLKPGTYVYHSGTHPQVQVQMGLYGPLTKDAAAGVAYPDDPARPGDQSVPYTEQKDLFFSEIDPALHQAVADGTYGTTGPTSTLDYHPKYFLVNGQPYSAGQACMSGLDIGDNVLLRLFNTGLRELAPSMLGSHFKVVAEGGNTSPFVSERYSVLLQPGSTKDLLFQPASNGKFPILERRLNLTNAMAPDGGMQTCLVVGPVPNTAPTANAQAVTTSEDTPAAITLTGSDAESDPLTFSVVTGPASGTLSGAGASRTYTPSANYFGPDSFTFKVNDGTVDSNVATVSITVNPVNDAPSFTAGANQTVAQPAGAQSVPNWATAISPGPANEAGQTVSFIVTNNNNALFSVQPAVAPNGTLAYTPAPAATGSATISVQAQDNGGTASGGVDTSAAQLRTITVTGGNTAPVAVNDSYTTAEDTPLSVPAPGVLGNDTDADSSPLTVAAPATIATVPAGSGSVTLDANGSFTYTPAPDYNGSASFTYQATDGTATSNTATVTITVTAVNDGPPVTVADSYSTPQNTPLVVPAPGVLANDSDPDGTPLTAQRRAPNPVNGTLTFNANGSFTYTPNPGFTGTDSFGYRARSGGQNGNTVTVTITVTSGGGGNTAPVAVNDSYSTAQNTPLSVPAPGVLGNDTDADGNPLSVLAPGTIATAPAGSGSVTLNANGSFTYTPATGFTGTATFSYQATDGTAPSNTAIVSISVTAAGADLIFQDGFESGNFSAWSAVVGADLSVMPAAAMGGSTQGMAADLAPWSLTAKYVQDATPAGEARYRARFYFHPNSTSLVADSFFTIMAARDGSGDVVRIEFGTDGLNYQVRAAVRNDAGGFTTGTAVDIGDAPHAIEIDWMAATANGANNGYVSLWVDGAGPTTLGGVDSDTLRVEESRLGPQGTIPSGVGGVLYFDGFVSHRTTAIGP